MRIITLLILFIMGCGSSTDEPLTLIKEDSIGNNIIMVRETMGGGFGFNCPKKESSGWSGCLIEEPSLKQLIDKIYPNNEIVNFTKHQKWYDTYWVTIVPEVREHEED